MIDQNTLRVSILFGVLVVIIAIIYINHFRKEYKKIKETYDKDIKEVKK